MQQGAIYPKKDEIIKFSLMFLWTLDIGLSKAASN